MTGPEGLQWERLALFISNSETLPSGLLFRRPAFFKVQRRDKMENITLSTSAFFSNSIQFCFLVIKFNFFVQKFWQFCPKAAHSGINSVAVPQRYDGHECSCMHKLVHKCLRYLLNWQPANAFECALVIWSQSCVLVSRAKRPRHKVIYYNFWKHVAFLITCICVVQASTKSVTFSCFAIQNSSVRWSATSRRYLNSGWVIA